MSDKIRVYKAIVKTPYGDLLFAVFSTEYDAKQDIMTAAQYDSKSHFGMLQVGQVTKSTRKLLKSMRPVRGTGSKTAKYWAYVKKA